MKTIPQVRKELKEVAALVRNNYSQVLGDKIIRLVKNMHRRKAVRRAVKEHAEFTPELAVRIRAYACVHPRISYMSMANVFHVSTGRISEAIAGTREAA